MKGVIEVTSGAYWQHLIDAPCGDCLTPRSALYIGAHCGGGVSFLPELDFAGYHVTIVEAFPENVAKLEEEFPGRYRIVHADVRKWTPTQKYDLVMWWHGPEHVTFPEAELVIPKLDACAKQWTIIGCPFGNYTQGAIYGNEFERHVTCFMPSWFAERGWECQELGEVNNGGILIAWRSHG